MTKSQGSSATRLIVVSAPSGAGKTTLCHRLLKDFPNLILSISCTTRPPRGLEKEGIDYFFLSPTEFSSRRELGHFVEWAEVHGQCYGTSKDFVTKALSDGKSLLLDIDVQGAKSIALAYPKEALRIFISPPSIEELEARLIARGTDDSRSIQRRLINARAEMNCAPEFDKIIINDDLERAYSELKMAVSGVLKQ